MNRADLQSLAETRLADGALLLQNGRYAGAYYMLGYAVECALKSSVARHVREHDFPDKKLVVDSHTHDLAKLLFLTGLRDSLDARASAEPIFAVNWGTVASWNEGSRYSTSITGTLAREFHSAVTDPKSGVLTWLRAFW